MRCQLTKRSQNAKIINNQTEREREKQNKKNNGSLKHFNFTNVSALLFCYQRRIQDLAKDL